MAFATVSLPLAGAPWIRSSFIAKLRPHHQHRRPCCRDAAPDVRFVLLEAPGLAAAADHHELAAVEPPGNRAKARDERITAGLEREHEAVRVVGGVPEVELADRPAGASRDLPVAEQVV